MSKTMWVAAALAILSLASCVPPASAQKLDATVLYRQNSDTDYSAVVPGYSATTDCAADITNPDCAAPAHAPGLNPAMGELAINVVGTTLSLLLPDGRVAVVNCVNKYSSRGTYINRRSCGMPLVEHVQAEIKGSSAKLEWPIGTDGRKTESETYRIVALLEKH
jgi:hypothetical protein